VIEFDKIHLVWRKGTGHRRVSVGILEKTVEGKHIFKYDPEAVNLQKTDGFTPYTEFQDLHKTYNGNVAEIFGQRLIKSDRTDVDTLYKFWEVDKEKADDKFYLLGKTQGLVPTDNFEFLAEYKLIPNLHFLTELASLSVNEPKLAKGTIQIGDKLRFVLEPENPKDKHAVKVYKDDLFIGYIKKYHSKVFYDAGADKLSLTVKAIDQNGFIKRLFVKVAF
jgi:hypothetical protein